MLKSFVAAFSTSKVLAVKLAIGLFSIWMSGALAGMFVTPKIRELAPIKPSPHLWLAINSPIQSVGVSPQIGIAGSAAIEAVHTEKLEQHAKEIEAGDADRRLLHDEIARISDREAKNYNELKDKLDVDETQTATMLKIAGIIFGFLQGIPALFTILDHRSKRQE